MRVKGMGKAIRRYREEAGITQERLAELVDISTNHLGAIERGENTYDGNICKAVECIRCGTE